MKPFPRHSAFTLIELLVVMAIIGILASLVLAGVAMVKKEAMKTRARQEMSNIATAISQYESKYGRLPLLPGVPTGASDVTFGWTGSGPATMTLIPSNAAIIAILMDEESYRNGQPTPNRDHVLNSGKVKFLNARPVSDLGLPGVGPDGEYRDPWGQPYIISLDYSLNDRCRDAVYSRAAVSQQAGQTGLKGLFNPIAPGNTDDYEHSGQALVWSKGPDKTAVTGAKANAGENKDNLLSWQ